MAELVNTRTDATTETFVFDDGTEVTAPRIAYVENNNTVHTAQCPVITKMLDSENPADEPKFKELPLADVIHVIDNGLETDLTECKACDKLRASQDSKENTMATATLTKPATKKTAPKAPAAKAVPAPVAPPRLGITLPPGQKTTPSLTAVISVLDKGTYGTTKEIATAAQVSDLSARGALLALENLGFLVHVTDSKTKVTTWAQKGTAPAPKKTADQLKATMAEKAANVATRKAAAAPPKATKAKVSAPAAGEEPKRSAAGAKQAAALEFLMKNPGVPFAVKDIEAGCGFSTKTLAGALGRMAELQVSGVQRAMAGKYKGFMFEAPKVATAKKK